MIYVIVTNVMSIIYLIWIPPKMPPTPPTPLSPYPCQGRAPRPQTTEPHANRRPCHGRGQRPQRAQHSTTACRHPNTPSPSLPRTRTSTTKNQTETTHNRPPQTPRYGRPCHGRGQRPQRAQHGTSACHHHPAPHSPSLPRTADKHNKGPTHNPHIADHHKPLTIAVPATDTDNGHKEHNIESQPATATQRLIRRHSRGRGQARSRSQSRSISRRRSRSRSRSIQRRRSRSKSRSRSRARSRSK